VLVTAAWLLLKQHVQRIYDQAARATVCCAAAAAAIAASIVCMKLQLQRTCCKVAAAAHCLIKPSLTFSTLDCETDQLRE
jgi:hypothetical protein